eukprot:COSAG02_NODE_60763_length_270_cov_0.894737_1_plen_45_part_01
MRLVRLPPGAGFSVEAREWHSAHLYFAQQKTKLCVPDRHRNSVVV